MMPIRMDLWRRAAGEFPDSFEIGVEESEYPPLVLVRYFKLGHGKNPSMFCMRKMHSPERTQIVLVKQASQPGICNTKISASVSLYTRNMSKLLVNLPFLANLVGFVASVQEEI
jgi:hypothetical protein